MPRNDLATQHETDDLWRRKNGRPIPTGWRATSEDTADNIDVMFARDRPKITIGQVREVKRLLLSGEFNRVEIAARTLVSRMTILAIEKHGRFWYV